MMGSGRYLAASIPLRLAGSGATVAIPVLAVQQTGDVALGGALVAAALAPSVLAAPIAGVLLDRSRHPRALIAAAGAICAVSLAVGALLGIIPIGLVVVALIVSGAVNPFFFGGLSSFVTDAIPDEHQAYASDALSYNIGAVVGPAIAAVAIGAGSPALAIGVLAAALLLGAGVALSLPLRAHAPAEEPIGILHDIRTAMGYLVSHRPLGVVILAGTVAQFGAGGFPIVAVAMTLQRDEPPEHAAWIVTAFAIGGLIGALIQAVRPIRRWAPPAIMGMGFAITGVFTIAAAPDLGLAWTLIVIGLSGFFTAASTVAMLLLRKQQSLPTVRSQIFTVGSGLRVTSAALGAALAGLLAGVDAAVLLALVGLVWIVSGALLLLYPRGTKPLAD